MTRATLLLAVTVLSAFACARDPQAVPSASAPTSEGTGMPSPPPSGDFDAGATPRSTLQQLANKPDDGRFVVEAIIVRVQTCHCPEGLKCKCLPDAIVVTNDFADSASWTLRTDVHGDLEKMFVVGGHYTLLVLVQNGEPRVIGGGAR